MDYKCEVCGHIGSEMTSYPTGQNGISLQFKNIINCLHCGYGRAFPFVEQERLDQFYESGEYWHDAGEGLALMAHSKNQDRVRVLGLKNYLPNKKNLSVLEIGAGKGYSPYWLKRIFKERVISYSFIEHDQNCSNEIILQNQDLHARKIGLQDLGTEQFDLIICNHVLEHLDNPVTFLKVVKSSLAIGGVCYIETPHRDDKFKKDVFPHTLFFTPQTFEKLGEKISVQTKEIITFGNPQSVSSASFFMKVKRKCYHLAIKLNIKKLQPIFDSLIFEYKKTRNDGMWLKWLFVN